MNSPDSARLPRSEASVEDSAVNPPGETATGPKRCAGTRGSGDTPPLATQRGSVGNRGPEAPFYLDPVIVLQILCIVVQAVCVSMVLRRFSTIHIVVWIASGTTVSALVLFLLALVYRTQRRVVLGVLNMASALMVGLLAHLAHFLSHMA